MKTSIITLAIGESALNATDALVESVLKYTDFDLHITTDIPKPSTDRVSYRPFYSQFNPRFPNIHAFDYNFKLYAYYNVISYRHDVVIWVDSDTMISDKFNQDEYIKEITEYKEQSIDVVARGATFPTIASRTNNTAFDNQCQAKKRYYQTKFPYVNDDVPLPLENAMIFVNPDVIAKFVRSWDNLHKMYRQQEDIAAWLESVEIGASLMYAQANRAELKEHSVLNHMFNFVHAGQMRYTLWGHS